MAYKYNEDEINDKLKDIIDLLEPISSDLTQIYSLKTTQEFVKKLEATEQISNMLVNKLNNIDVERTIEQHAHFIKTTQLLIDISKIRLDMINFEVNKIDPSPPGLASKLSNKLYNIKKQHMPSDDEGILWDILKVLSKPFSYVMGIFEAITPDKWRVASNWEKVKLVTGLTLTLVGVACVIAAIVLSVANPVGLAVVGGVGLTVVFGSIYLGLASALCLGVGAVFLNNTGRALSAKLGEKRKLQNMSNECEKSIDELDNIIKLDKVISLVDKKNNPPLTPMLANSSLLNVEKNVLSIQSFLKTKLNISK